MTMTADNEVWNPETEQWEPVSEDGRWMIDDSNSDEKVADTDDPAYTDSSYEPESVSTPNCSDIGKRHKYKDRQTGETFDVCIVCGEPRPKPGQKRTASVSTGTRGAGKAGGTIEMLLSGGWMLGGYVARRSLPKPVGPAVGKTMMLEAALAGPTLHKALKKTPIYPYLALATGQLSWAADLIKLLTPPLLMGAISLRPELIEAGPIRAMLTASLVPALAEAAKKAEAQKQLLESLEGYNQDTIDAADSIIDAIIHGEDDESKTD